jgi:hypothetical protein
LYCRQNHRIASFFSVDVHLFNLFLSPPSIFSSNIIEAREARDEMDRFRIKGCELEVVFAQERRKSPNEMRGRVVNQQNVGRDGGQDGGGGGGRENAGRRSRDRSSSFERHQKQRRRDEGKRRDSDTNREKDDNRSAEPRMDEGDNDKGAKEKERLSEGKDGEE